MKLTEKQTEKMREAVEQCLADKKISEEMADTIRALLSAARLVPVLMARVESCEHMLACYRVGRRPSEIALDKARTTQEELDAALTAPGVKMGDSK